MVKGDWIKPGAAVIDVGTNRVDDDSIERGYFLKMDEFEKLSIILEDRISDIPHLQVQEDD